MKFYTGEFYEKLSGHFSLVFSWMKMGDTIYEDM